MRVQVTMAALAALAAPALAQQAQPTAPVPVAAATPTAAPAGAAGPSVENYVCTFTGKCGGEATTADVTMDSGATKGFRVARPVLDTPAPASAAARPSKYVAARPAPHGVAPVSYGHRAPAHVIPPSVAPATMTTGAARPRADLMIGFERNSARISGEGIASARIFAQSLLTPDLSGKRFVIEGHTDLRGGRQTNMALSAKRAQAVTEYLVSQGVDRSRLMSRGIGPDVPLPGHSPSDPSNRRVEAELLP